MSKKIVAIVGSYRKHGVTDTAVDAVLEAAREKGARTNKIYLIEQHIEFCTNCRECMQAPGNERGICVQKDDLQAVLEEIESADALILSSPVNCGNVTAIFRRFMERLVGYAWWPWGRPTPATRQRSSGKRAVLISSSAMPSLMMTMFTGAPRALRQTAGIFGAKVVGKFWIGLAARSAHYRFSDSELARARRLGSRLAAS